jgi:tRNA A37 methylthiotransferase MiaB
VLLDAGYTQADSVDGAAVVLANTCAIRENAETKVRVTRAERLFNTLRSV